MGVFVIFGIVGEMNPLLRNLLIGTGIAVLLGAGFYIYSSRNAAPASVAAKQPSLERPYEITIEMPEDAKTTLRANVVKLHDMLQADPQNYDAWLDLATHYKIAGDFEGAEEVWNYLLVAGPSTMKYILLGNLGNLYLYFKKDYPKAEEYYLQALAIAPDEISFYADMYRMYAYAYKTDTTAARDILEKGIKINPENTDLKGLLEEYNKTHGQ